MFSFTAYDFCTILLITNATEFDIGGGGGGGQRNNLNTKVYLLINNKSKLGIGWYTSPSFPKPLNG